MSTMSTYTRYILFQNAKNHIAIFYKSKKNLSFTVGNKKLIKVS